jgi:hypothetical protein
VVVEGGAAAASGLLAVSPGSPGAARTWADIERASFDPVGMPGELGWSGSLAIADRPSGVLRISGAPSEWRARSEDPARLQLIEDPDDPHTVYLDLERAGAVVISEPSMPDLVLRWRHGLLDVWSSGRPPEAIPGPAADWVKDATVDDSWLAVEVSRRLDVHIEWESALAVGLLARCRRSTPERARRIVERQLRGEIDSDLLRPVDWARALSAVQRDRLEDLALAKVAVLEDALEGLLDDPLPDDESWRESVLRACHDRDDIQAVLVLLREIGAGERVQGVLPALDRLGRILIGSIPGGLIVDDERLARVTSVAVDCWWTAPAQ